MKLNIQRFVDARTDEQREAYQTIEQQRADALLEIKRQGNTASPLYPEWRSAELARKYAPADAYEPDDIEEEDTDEEEES